MYRVDITADLNDEDEPGYIWTFPGEASDPGQIKPGALSSPEPKTLPPSARWPALRPQAMARLCT